MMSDNQAKILQDDANFLVELIDWQGQPAVKKTVKATAEHSRAERLKNDVLGMQLFARIADQHPELGLYIPKVYDHGTDFYIREYIGGDTLITSNMVLAEAAPRLDKQVHLLAGLDKIETNEQIGYVGSSNYKNLLASIPRWADENVRDGIISAAEADRAKQILTTLNVSIAPRIIHGDMSPLKHAYLYKDGRITLIDFENFSSTGARYFDVAWNYTRLYSFAGSTDIPRYFLAEFIRSSQPTAQEKKELFATLLQRTLGMQKDAVSNFKDKDMDYRDRAKQLLEIVLKNDLGLLYD